jgi:hypothetical protein
MVVNSNGLLLGPSIYVIYGGESKQLTQRRQSIEHTMSRWPPEAGDCSMGSAGRSVQKTQDVVSRLAVSLCEYIIEITPMPI